MRSGARVRITIEQVVLIIHVLMAIGIVGLILIQQGKGADAGASFGGGASQTVFGVQGSGNALTRWTSIIAAIFFVTSLSLAYFAKQKSQITDEMIIDVPSVEMVVEEADGEVPVLESVDEQSDSVEVPQLDMDDASVVNDAEDASK